MIQYIEGKIRMKPTKTGKQRTMIILTLNDIQMLNDIAKRSEEGTAMLWIMNGKGGYPYCSIVETERLDD